MCIVDVFSLNLASYRFSFFEMADPATAEALAAVKDEAFIIDCRNEDEKGEGVCERANAIPWKSWTQGAAEGLKVPPEGSGLPEDKAAAIITHCRGGGRGGKLGWISWGPWTSSDTHDFTRYP